MVEKASNSTSVVLLLGSSFEIEILEVSVFLLVLNNSVYLRPTNRQHTSLSKFIMPLKLLASLSLGKFIPGYAVTRRLHIIELSF